MSNRFNFNKRKLLSQYRKVEKQVNDRSDSERGLILLTVIVMVVMLFFTSLVEPILKERKTVNRRYASSEVELRRLNQRLQAVVQGIAVDPLRPLKMEREELKKHLAMIDDALRQLTQNLVPAEEMRHLLEEMLEQEPGLEVLHLQNVDGVALSSMGEGEEAEQLKQYAMSLYSHGMVVLLKGDYYSTTSFLRNLETSDYSLIWDSIEYQVTGYPDAEVTIVIRTLSNHEDWIGV